LSHLDYLDVVLAVEEYTEVATLSFPGVSDEVGSEMSLVRWLLRMRRAEAELEEEEEGRVPWPARKWGAASDCQLVVETFQG